MSAPSLPLCGVDVSAGATVQALLDMLNRAERVLDVDPGQARIFIGQASRLLAPPLDAPRKRTAALAPWQERKVLRHIAENLARTTCNRELAELVGLSAGHFARRFKGSFGASPRDYVIRGRVERAKTLMRETDASLCQIALDSGFCDQAHMSRQFHAVVGSSPSRWRRQQPHTLVA